MEYSGLRAPIDITKSVKLEQYYNSQNLSAEDNKFVNEIDISKLFMCFIFARFILLVLCSHLLSFSH